MPINCSCWTSTKSTRPPPTAKKVDNERSFQFSESRHEKIGISGISRMISSSQPNDSCFRVPPLPARSRTSLTVLPALLTFPLDLRFFARDSQRLVEIGRETVPMSAMAPKLSTACSIGYEYTELRLRFEADDGPEMEGYLGAFENALSILQRKNVEIRSCSLCLNNWQFAGNLAHVLSDNLNQLRRIQIGEEKPKKSATTMKAIEREMHIAEAIVSNWVYANRGSLCDLKIFTWVALNSDLSLSLYAATLLTNLTLMRIYSYERNFRLERIRRLTLDSTDYAYTDVDVELMFDLFTRFPACEELTLLGHEWMVHQIAIDLALGHEMTRPFTIHTSYNDICKLSTEINQTIAMYRRINMFGDVSMTRLNVMSDRGVIVHCTVQALVISVSVGLPDCVFIERMKANGWQIASAIPALATSAFQQRQPVAVLLDTRIPDLIALSRLLHTLPASDDVLFVALAERWPTEKRRRSLSQADLVHIVLSSSTDTGLLELLARLATRCRAMPALFAVLEEADQPIEVCDEDRTVQFVNRAYEAVTGCHRAEVLGSQANESRRRSLHRISVIAETDGATIRRVSNDWHCITVPSSLHSSQYVYVKRGSSDAFMCRDMSLKSVRSQNALVDAPISEVIGLLREALTRSEGDTQQLVKDAVRVLTSTELYAPSITRFSRDTDRIASGYYDGLIKLHHPSRQRKRSVVDAYRDKRSLAGPSLGARRVSADLKLALANDAAWNFDVLNLERLSDQHALLTLGQKVFDRWKVAEALGCTSDVLSRWLTAIEAHYHPENAYHNATHAADVLQATAYFLDARRVGEVVQDTHAVAALLAATVHDLDHPGRGNAFLINTKHSLALLYNDQSVLENHHVALAFQLTLGQPAINIFAAMPREEFSAMRQAIVDMVLATDMSRHFEYLARFQQTMANMQDVDEEKDTSMTVCRMMIKCADIGNPTREFELCQKWAYRIVEEYFEQTAEEREKGLPLTMELFDRTVCNVPLTQCGFIDMFAREMFSTWGEFAGMPQLLIQLESNYDRWKEQTSTWTPAKNAIITAQHGTHNSHHHQPPHHHAVPIHPPTTHHS